MVIYLKIAFIAYFYYQTIHAVLQSDFLLAC